MNEEAHRSTYSVQANFFLIAFGGYAIFHMTPHSLSGSPEFQEAFDTNHGCLECRSQSGIYQLGGNNTSKPLRYECITLGTRLALLTIPRYSHELA